MYKIEWSSGGGELGEGHLPTVNERYVYQKTRKNSLFFRTQRKNQQLSEAAGNTLHSHRERRETERETEREERVSEREVCFMLCSPSPTTTLPRVPSCAAVSKFTYWV